MVERSVAHTGQRRARRRLLCAACTQIDSEETANNPTMKADISSPLEQSLSISSQIQTNPASQLFNSFWIAGFEASCQINRAGQRVDMIAATQHDRLAHEDYARVKKMGFGTVRDGIRWHLIDRGGRYDFSSFAPMLRAARENGVQVIWDICHYGWPTDIDLFSTAFVDRFARFSAAVARFLRDEGVTPPCFVPINEISFFTWAVSTRGIFHPYELGRSHELKRQLVRAAIAGMEAIWAIEPRARFVQVDPVFNVVVPNGRPDLAKLAKAETDSQYEGWDLLGGLKEPQLGGSLRYLDIIGVNYYSGNQWEVGEQALDWDEPKPDERRVPFSTLLNRVHKRYGRPMFVSETGHFGTGRARWAREVAEEVQRARAMGIPVGGICLYPIIDRPDWDDASHWHNSGLWDLQEDSDGVLQRVICATYAAELRELIPVAENRR
jgi:beta-glucosidase/6-phospho-beta-glucosidase/beta-galactosidase